MSRVKLLLDVVNDMRSLADSLQAIADAIVSDEPTKVSETKTSKDIPQKAKTTTKEETKTLSLEDIRGKLAEISQAGKTTQERELIKKYGGIKLSDVDPSKYVDIMKEAEVIANV